MNSIQLIGYIATDLELEPLPGGEHVKAEFRLSVRRAKADKSGRDVDFFSITTFGKTAETLTKYKAKGDQIAVSGRLTTDEWKNDADERRSKTYVIGERIDFVGSAPANNTPAGSDGE